MTQAVENGFDKVLLTKSDVACIFGIAERTVLAWTAADRLPRPIRIGKKPLWLREVIDAKIEEAARVAHKLPTKVDRKGRVENLELALMLGIRSAAASAQMRQKNLRKYG